MRSGQEFFTSATCSPVQTLYISGIRLRGGINNGKEATHRSRGSDDMRRRRNDLRERPAGNDVCAVGGLLWREVLRGLRVF